MSASHCPTVSVISVNFNGLRMLGNLFSQFVKSLRDQEYCGKIEIIVIDNNSDDNSPNLIRELIPDAKLLRLKENVGYIKAVNIALRYAHGDYLLILNNDVILPGRFIQKAVLRMKELEEKIKGAVVLVPLQIVGDGNKILGMLHVVNALGQALPLDYLAPREIYRNLYIRLPQCWSDNFIDGAAFLLPRTILTKLGNILFIPFFKMYFDDVELGLRLRAKNVKIIFCKDIIIYHRLYATSRQVLQLNKYINFSTNRLSVFLSFVKDTHKKLLLATILTVFDLAQLLFLALRSKSLYFKTVIKYLKELRNVWEYSIALSNYYESIKAEMSTIIGSFREIIFVPKWLCRNNFTAKILVRAIAPFLLLAARMLQLSLYKKYKTKGLRYRCVDTTI